MLYTKYPAIAQLAGGLVVSCQAWPDTPLYGPVFQRAMAQCGLQAGAKGIRANGGPDIRTIKEAVPLVLIGINKAPNRHGVKVITPTLESAREVVEAGADIVAVDCTFQAWPDGGELEAHIRAITAELQRPVMADVATVAEGERAIRLGAAFVATTMSGYTRETESRKANGLPDFDLIVDLKRALGDVPVLAEGRFWQPEQAARALELGAHCVCVGTAITAPWEIARRFAAAMEGRR